MISQAKAKAAPVKASKAFNEVELEAMRAKNEEEKAARKGKNSRELGEKALREAIAGMKEPDRSLAERIHAIVTATAPELMTPSEKIDRRIAELDDWRGEMLAELRKTILSVDKEIVETWKWMGSPVWELDGILAVATVLKAKVKLTFSNGAALPDPHGVFNAGLGGGKWRAVDVAEGDKIDKKGLKALIRAAIEYNRSARLEKTARRAPAVRAKSAKR